MARTASTIKTSNGISWYVEQEGSGPDIVLIPDGLGECAVFNKSIPKIAMAGFRVTTFDMPGFSRSSDAPVETYTQVTAQKLSSYVINLLDALEIREATFFGCSSAGSTVLALCKDYPDRVRNALAHEVPTTLMDHLLALMDKTDEDIVASMDAQNKAMAGEEGWQSLGTGAHKRLKENYVTWARGYPLTIPHSAPMDALDEVAKRPLVWSVGALTPMGAFFSNVVGATKAGIELIVLPGGHFPYISHPDMFADHVVRQAKKHV